MNTEHLFLPMEPDRSISSRFLSNARRAGTVIVLLIVLGLGATSCAANTAKTFPSGDHTRNSAGRRKSAGWCFGKTTSTAGGGRVGTEDACHWERAMRGVRPMLPRQLRLPRGMQMRPRVPLNEDCWLGINGVSRKWSGADYRKRIKEWVLALNKAGLTVILDLHWSAPGDLEALGQWPMPDADHALTFRKEVAQSTSRPIHPSSSIYSTNLR